MQPVSHSCHGPLFELGGLTHELYACTLLAVCYKKRGMSQNFCWPGCSFLKLACKHMQVDQLLLK